MSKIFEEALADAKKLKEVAEENAKQAILESVTPKIRKFIDEQISQQNNIVIEESHDHDNQIKDMMNMLGIDNNSGTIQQALSNMQPHEINTLEEVAKKIKLDGNLSRNEINTQYKELFKEISMNKERYYEVDLAALRESVEQQADEMYAQEEMKADMEEINDENEDEGSVDEDSYSEGDYLEEDDHYGEGLDDYSLDEEDELEKDKSVDEMINEIKLALDLGEDIEEEMLPEELRGMIIPEEEDSEEGDVEMEDLEGDLGEEDSEEEDSEDDLPPLGGEEELPQLDEIFDIDPRMLQQELRNIRNSLNEGKVDHHFGGKGGAKAGHKNAFGGSGPKKHGHQKSFGGGSYGKDPFVNPPGSLKKLNETIKKLRRTNRAQTEKLNQYRSAVQTLREQLEDLNLFNAKLLYVNKLLQNKGLDSNQKKSVIRALDEAKSLSETKALYKSLTESLGKKKSTLNESTVFGSSSRTTSSGSGKKQTLGESDRWAKLAGLK